ncbi:MAG TPA: sugar nucleotide-binding protein [Caulobacteraceae bacterium]|nr:sugar nucleotide-binding protein [Caulobacteraceae bacterium]
MLVAGGRGRVARALTAAGGARVHALSRAELDIRDPDAVAACLRRLRPRAVINSAVVGSLEAVEADIAAARAVNADGPGVLALACAAAGVPLVHLSTDYVFGAPTDRPWREDDPVSPVNAYGAMKAEGERRVLESGAAACVARVAWVFGDGEDFLTRMLRGGPEVIIAEQVGSPTPIGPLAGRLLALAAKLAEGAAVPPILHLAGTPPASRADWVEAAFDAYAAAGGGPPRVVRAGRGSFSAAVSRPGFSALDCSAAAALFGGPLDWKAALPALARLWLADKV